MSRLPVIAVAADGGETARAWANDDAGGGTCGSPDCVSSADHRTIIQLDASNNISD